MAFNPWSSAFHGTDETIAYNLSFMGDQLLRATSLSAWDKSDPGFRNFISQLSLLWKETRTRDPSRCWAVLQFLHSGNPVIYDIFMAALMGREYEIDYIVKRLYEVRSLSHFHEHFFRLLEDEYHSLILQHLTQSREMNSSFLFRISWDYMDDMAGYIGGLFSSSPMSFLVSYWLSLKDTAEAIDDTRLVRALLNLLSSGQPVYVCAAVACGLGQRGAILPPQFDQLPHHNLYLLRGQELTPLIWNAYAHGDAYISWDGISYTYKPPSVHHGALTPPPSP
ncbi:hypothetical protein BJX65DRAFT_315104 [Aspergillus insuetus]